MKVTDYSLLSPDLVLDAVESCGYLSDARTLALNSYENRVYQVGIEDQLPIIAKFYRPCRWSDQQIQEEHDYSWQLKDIEIPVVAPLKDKDGKTLFEYKGYKFALFPRQGGRTPELDYGDTLVQIGRFLGRIHAMGESKTFKHRPEINVETYGKQSVQWLLQSGFIEEYLRPSYEAITQRVLEQVEQKFAEVGDYPRIRLHADVHPSNILWRDNGPNDSGPHFVDLDDCRNGPAVQDLWMLLSGSRNEMQVQLEDLLEGYEEFCHFDHRQLVLIEALRSLRMMHYAAWLGRRWDDPAFPVNFPWFNTTKYWEEHILTLKEQSSLLDELPLSLNSFNS
ncbi:serine/threonine protein kinase [Pelagibaculum spongiae]|uniref:serine/threonine protein kinase n=1 Tax=Pelagibaculum spongiae TaxID=2080658 RepID=UPI001F4ED4D5|nr:serine/threonine protein kinase [Pelagibaculum spongiae]